MKKPQSAIAKLREDILLLVLKGYTKQEIFRCYPILTKMTQPYKFLDEIIEEAGL